MKYPWGGNVRELEQCVRSVLLKGFYPGDMKTVAPDLTSMLKDGIEKGEMDAQELLSGYCYLLYKREGSYEGVSRRTNLDRRTVKKYIELWKAGN